jgi:PilZ domain
MAERRRSLRKKSFLRGCVYFNKRRSAIDCLIRDISDQGARIIFSGATNFPDAVELYIPHKEQTVRAHVQWRRGDEVGLAFPDAAAAPAPAPLASPQPQFGDLAQRVAELEAEMAGLRRTLKQLKRELPGGDVDAA